MTDSERFGTALALALFAHFAFLYIEVPYDEGGHVNVRQVSELETSSFASQSVEEGLALEAVSSPSADQQAANKRHEVRQLFLEDVCAAIHARRFIMGDRSLIGFAVYSLVIDGKGFFSDIHVEQSSGKPDLDKAAFIAIQSASGIVKRPSLLGDDAIQLILSVKYQYDLQ